MYPFRQNPKLKRNDITLYTQSVAVPREDCGVVSPFHQLPLFMAVSLPAVVFGGKVYFMGLISGMTSAAASSIDGDNKTAGFSAAMALMPGGRYSIGLTSTLAKGGKVFARETLLNLSKITANRAKNLHLPYAKLASLLRHGFPESYLLLAQLKSSGLKKFSIYAKNGELYVETFSNVVDSGKNIEIISKWTGNTWLKQAPNALQGATRLEDAISPGHRLWDIIF